MINFTEVRETNEMIEKENLDVRTITMGISLLDCADPSLPVLCSKIYEKIHRTAKDLVRVGEEIARDYRIPIVNKRISVTPISLIAGSECRTTEDYVQVAKTLDSVAKDVGVNFIGGFSALVSKSMTPADALTDGYRVRIRKRRLHEDRHQHGRSAPFGQCDQRDRPGDGGQRFHRVRQARRLLQRAG